MLEVVKLPSVCRVSRILPIDELPDTGHPAPSDGIAWIVSSAGTLFQMDTSMLWLYRKLVTDMTPLQQSTWRGWRQRLREHHDGTHSTSKFHSDNILTSRAISGNQEQRLEMLL
eukprot:2241201-Amphidinium_carterae.1